MAIRSCSIGRRACLAALGVAVVPARGWAGDGPSAERWAELAPLIFPGRVVQDGATLLAIEAPMRAEDAAVVPVALRVTLAADDGREIRRITLVVEANPSPVAAVFELGAAAGVDRIATRVRVNDYTYLRAIAELSDGALYATARFIKAAGGCSAPALNQTVDPIPLGTLRLREFPAPDAQRREVQVMIRHPNYSGMQMDQISRLYIPAEFLQEVAVSLGERRLLTVQSGISISENPAFRFSFRDDRATNPGAGFRVTAVDSDGRHFSGSFPASAAM